MDEILDEKTYETRNVVHASFWQRSAAVLMDIILLTMISYGIYYMFRQTTAYLLFLEKYSIPTVLIIAFYFIYFDGSEKNATIGKQIMNIRMLKEEKMDVDFFTSAKHFLFSVLLFFGFFRLLSKEQTLADKYCKVMVILR